MVMDRKRDTPANGVSTTRTGLRMEKVELLGKVCITLWCDGHPLSKVASGVGSDGTYVGTLNLALEDPGGLFLC